MSLIDLSFQLCCLFNDVLTLFQDVRLWLLTDIPNSTKKIADIGSQEKDFQEDASEAIHIEVYQLYLVYKYLYILITEMFKITIFQSAEGARVVDLTVIQDSPAKPPSAYMKEVK